MEMARGRHQPEVKQFNLQPSHNPPSGFKSHPFACSLHSNGGSVCATIQVCQTATKLTTFSFAGCQHLVSPNSGPSKLMISSILFSYWQDHSAQAIWKDQDHCPIQIQGTPMPTVVSRVCFVHTEQCNMARRLLSKGKLSFSGGEEARWLCHMYRAGMG